LSQIEPRVLAWFADYEDMLDIFRAKGDPYAQFGARMFNIPNLTKESHPDLRQSAKSALLGCGYQLGWASFAAQLLVGFLGAPPVRYDTKFAKNLLVTQDYAERFLDWEDNREKMLAIPHTCTTKELLIHCIAAKKIIDIYRSTAHTVTGFWELCQHLIQKSLADGEEYTHKCVTFRKGEIVLPNGMSLLYPDLRQQKGKDGRPEWVYGPNATKLYAGKIVNNVVQGTARIVMTDGMLRTAARYPVVGTVHDEQIVMVPEKDAQEALSWILEQMTLEPRYMPGIPLAADGGVHRRYGLAKS
jgi:DNA polymerase I-like protein with 3'-5' exonuclease and polymerase domains